ncbi:transposase [Corynebacterium rouxii]|uniref:transposase n=1 Tax=Corynebacterium rouxii TaxID=2719119 RepID=UPI00140DEAF7|nr:transposase [Corynebacterium rouxii]
MAHSKAINASQLDARGHVTKRLPEDLVAENARLRREKHQLRDTNELLKATSAFFASEPDLKR